jgi:hypothetical protein
LALATTEAHYLQRQAHGPDVVLCWISTQAAIVETESIRKVSDSGRVDNLGPRNRKCCERFQRAEEIRTPNLLIRRHERTA